MTQLTIDIQPNDTVGEITEMRFSGVMDNSSISQINTSFDSLLERKPSFVIVELSGVSYIASAALGELMGGRKTVIEWGGDLVLSSMSLDLKTRLTLLGAHKVFKFFPDVRGAVNAYQWEFEGKPETLALGFPPKLKFVPPVRQLISRLAKQKGYSNRDAFRVETIIDEICNNAIEHGRQDSADNVALSIGIDRKKIEINVASASDPSKIEALKNFFQPKPEKPTNTDDKRGRGLALIKLLSSELSINFSEGGTCVHATKLKEE